MSKFADLTDKTVLVTGASSGIGRAAAKRVSELGGTVILTGRDEARLQSTLESLDGDGHFVRPFDLANTDDIPTWMQSIAQETGKLDSLIHMAGIHAAAPLRMLDSAQVERIFAANVGVSVGLARGFRHKKVRGQNPSIVFASSASALVGEPGVSIYSASKGAIASLTRSLAIELVPERIRVNCISPAIVRTEMTDKFQATLPEESLQLIREKHPLGFGEAVDVANSAVFLISDEARWITGTNLVIDGGYSAQ